MLFRLIASTSLAGRIIVPIVLIGIVALGLVMACFPAECERVRSHFPGYQEASLSYTRLLGAVFAGFGLALLILFLIFAA